MSDFATRLPTLNSLAGQQQSVWTLIKCFVISFIVFMDSLISSLITFHRLTTSPRNHHLDAQWSTSGSFQVQQWARQSNLALETRLTVVSAVRYLTDADELWPRQVDVWRPSSSSMISVLVISNYSHQDHAHVAPRYEVSLSTQSSLQIPEQASSCPFLQQQRPLLPV